jgi:hypothetical protein
MDAPAPLVHGATDTLPTGGVSVPHLHAILRPCSRGLSVRWLLLRASEGKPPVPMGRMHVSPSLWRRVLEPALRARADWGVCRFTVDDQAGR